MIVDAVLGMDFIGLFDEVRIYPKDKKSFFPRAPHLSHLTDVT